MGVPSSGRCRLRVPYSALLGAVWLGVGQIAAAQTAGTFDIERFSNFGEGWFETFYVDETNKLRDVVDAGVLVDDTKLLITETAAGPLALVLDQMAFHHIAQGRAQGKDWMATF